MLQVVANFVLFQVCWFASILGAAKGEPWIGPAAVAASAVGQMYWRSSFRGETSLLLSAAGFGVLLDGILERFGVIAFVDGRALDGLSVIPLWMIGLWINFGTTLPSSLAWLRSKPGLAAVLGGIGGPLAYYGGAQFGAISFGDSYGTWGALGIVGLEYVIATPLLVLLSNVFLPKKKPREADGSR